ncbi:MAG TPA: DoxX family protein [Flavobacteriales bacterium]|nr:DoxX family protein [Flavobacteriales bacterium]
MTIKTILRWIPNVVAAIILLQTLFFKFSAAPESVYIFSSIGAEPSGRIGSGVVELIAAVLLLWPSFAWAGALLALGTMSGAILTHLAVLGIEVMGDGGTLFALACIVWLASAWVLFRDRQNGLAFVRRFRQD